MPTTSEQNKRTPEQGIPPATHNAPSVEQSAPAARDVPAAQQSKTASVGQPDKIVEQVEVTIEQSSTLFSAEKFESLIAHTLNRRVDAIFSILSYILGILGSILVYRLLR